MLTSIVLTAAIMLIIVVLMAASIAVVEFFDRLADKAADKVNGEPSFEKVVEQNLSIVNQ